MSPAISRPSVVAVLVGLVLIAGCRRHHSSGGPGLTVSTGEGGTGGAGSESAGTSGSPEPEPKPDVSGLTVTNSDARACDLLLEEVGEARATGATFDELVRGSLQTRSPLVAISFFSRVDQGFENTPVSIETRGPAPALVLREATCYDRRGQVVEDADVELFQTEEGD
ncbi:MAG: hypothetical protein JW751_23220 [Polyangiaceae bacterium]|nr:hypothetical protein [Polyangiaceae bacterium]